MSIFPLQITPELIRSLRAFVARSSERDAINDEARIAAVERSVDLALEGLKKEKRGLIRRVKRTVTVSTGASPETAAAANSGPSAFEQAEERIRSLERQVQMFQRIKDLLDEGRSRAST